MGDEAQEQSQNEQIRALEATIAANQERIGELERESERHRQYIALVEQHDLMLPMLQQRQHRTLTGTWRNQEQIEALRNWVVPLVLSDGGAPAPQLPPTGTGGGSPDRRVPSARRHRRPLPPYLRVVPALAGAAGIAAAAAARQLWKTKHAVTIAATGALLAGASAGTTAIVMRPAPSMAHISSHGRRQNPSAYVTTLPADGDQARPRAADHGGASPRASTAASPAAAPAPSPSATGAPSPAVSPGGSLSPSPLPSLPVPSLTPPPWHHHPRPLGQWG